MISSFSNFLNKIFERILAYNKIVFLIIGLIIVMAFFFIPDIKTELRIYDSKDPNFKSTIDYHLMKDLFSNHDSFLLIVRKKSGRKFFEKDLCYLKDWEHAYKKNNLYIYKVISSLSLKYPVWDEIQIKYNNFLDYDCEKLNSSKIISFENFKGSPFETLFTSKGSSDDITFEVQFKKLDDLKFNPKMIGVALESLLKHLKEKKVDAQVYLGGRSAFQWHLNNSIKKDSYLNLAILIVLVGLLKLFFGTWRSGIYLTITLIISSTILLLIMSLLGWPIDLLSNALFLMMCIAGVQDFIFLSYHFKKHNKSFKDTFSELITPCFFTSLTTAVGFMSLALSSLPTIKHFGLLAAMSAIIEWGVTFFVLPSIIKTFNLKRDWISFNRILLYSLIEKLNLLRPTVTQITSSILIFIVSVIGFFYIEVNDHPSKNFPENHLMTKTYKYIKKTRGWEGIIYLVLDNSTSVENKKSILTKIKKDSNILKILSISEHHNYLLRLLPQNIAHLVNRQMEVYGFWERFYPKDQSFHNLGFGKTRSVIFLKSFNLKDVTKTIQYIRGICSPKVCWPSGEGVVYSEYTNKIVTTLWKSFSLTLFFILLVVILLSKFIKKRSVLKMVLAIIWGPVIMIGICALFKIPMNFVTGIFVTVLVGMTGDNAIHYLFATKDKNTVLGINDRGGASLIVAIVAAISSLIFLFFSMVPLNTLGLLLAGGLIASVLGDQFLFKGLLTLSKQNKS